MEPENPQSEFVADCTSTEDFIRRYYKRLDRDLATWGDEFLRTKVASYDAEIVAHGYATISAHDSVTGRIVKFRPERDQAAAPIIASPDDIDPAFADRAFNGTSWTPEKRGYLYRNDYANGVNGFYAEMWPLAKTDEQKALLAAEMGRYRHGYLERMKAYLGSHANVVSPYIADPSKFPSARMQKRGQWADNKLNELTEWGSRARQTIKARILEARPPDAKLEAEWGALRRDMTRSIGFMAAIDQRGEPYNRSAFTNSIAGKIERLAHNGDVALVEKALAWLTEHNLDSGKPAFTPRHKVWTFGNAAKEVAAKVEARAGKPNELIAEAMGIELWADFRIERAQLVFPHKPSHETREKLKRSGWKWSPDNGAWQRQLTEAALQSGKHIVAGLNPTPEITTEGPAL